MRRCGVSCVEEMCNKIKFTLHSNIHCTCTTSDKRNLARFFNFFVFVPQVTSQGCVCEVRYDLLVVTVVPSMQPGAGSHATSW